MPRKLILVTALPLETIPFRLAIICELMVFVIDSICCFLYQDGLNCDPSYYLPPSFSPSKQLAN